MQYSTGTVTFTNGSATVTGFSTNWNSGNVVAGQQIHHADFPLAAYTISSVNYGAQTLQLTTNYTAPTASGVYYVVVSDYTPNLNLPEIGAGDIHAAQIVTRALRKLDVAYAGLAATNTFHIAASPPTDTSLIWLDTSGL